MSNQITTFMRWTTTIQGVDVDTGELINEPQARVENEEYEIISKSSTTTIINNHGQRKILWKLKIRKDRQGKLFG